MNEYEEYTKAVLSRYSIFDMAEQKPEAMDAAEDAGAEGRITDSGNDNLIDWWKIQSSGREYQIRSCLGFWYCSCPSFFYSRKACKHIPLVTAPTCRNCRKRGVNSFGETCSHCEVSAALYLKESSDAPVEMVGRFRI